MTDTATPTIPSIADLLPARVRALIYLLSVMLAPAFAVVEANTDLHYGWLAGYAGWNGLVGLLAVSNTPTVHSDDRGAIDNGFLWTIVGFLAAVALAIWIIREIR